MRLTFRIVIAVLVGMQLTTGFCLAEDDSSSRIRNFLDEDPPVATPKRSPQKDKRSSSQATRPQSGEYRDSRGNKVHLSCGSLAFATKVAEYRVGSPSPKRAVDRNPTEALGEPDYNASRDTGFVTLGCGGSLTLEFTRSVIVDVPGPDIYIFEIGPDIEPTQLELSADGNRWINIGKISGGKASVDIQNFVSPNDRFRFVRLTDLKSACGGNTPGADIDAVAAVGCIPVQAEADEIPDKSDTVDKLIVR